MTERKAYEAPSIVEIGTLQDLTLLNKEVGNADGSFLIVNGVPTSIKNDSV